MAGLEAAPLVGEGVKILVKEAEERGWIESLFDAFKKKHVVILFGSTGTGKSSLLRSLKKMMPQAIAAINRTEYAEVRKIKVGKRVFRFIDTPGHPGRTERGKSGPHVKRKAEIEKARKGEHGEFTVLNLVSNGFHEYRNPEPEPEFLNGKVKEEWLRIHRDREIFAMKEWLNKLGNSNNLRSVLTVASKADQWWSQQRRVIKYYEKGDYAKVLEEHDSIGTSVVPYCARIQKFYEQGILDGAYDGTDLEKHRIHLLNILLSAVGHPADE